MNFYRSLSHLKSLARRISAASPPTTGKSWNAKSSRWRNAAHYCSCCLVDDHESGTPPEKKTFANCFYPYKEPTGEINLKAIASAAAYIAGARGASTPPEIKKKAARKLISVYRRVNRKPPPNLLKISGQKQP